MVSPVYSSVLVAGHRPYAFSRARETQISAALVT